MAALPWQWWLPIAAGQPPGSQPSAPLAPNPLRFADELRKMADAGEPIPPALLHALADMLDNPKGYAGAKLKVVRIAGGRRAKYDWVEIGRITHERVAAGDPPDAAVNEIAKKFGCSERAVWRFLAEYREAIAAADAERDD